MTSSQKKNHIINSQIISNNNGINFGYGIAKVKVEILLAKETLPFTIRYSSNNSCMTLLNLRHNKNNNYIILVIMNLAQFRIVSRKHTFSRPFDYLRLNIVLSSLRHHFPCEFSASFRLLGTSPSLPGDRIQINEIYRLFNIQEIIIKV